ncbi:MAG: hypothetical protein Q7R22_003505 [Verrucomicrobiota bacterium JB025]|nr:hypothetical protein [Verrucomicrobiota bacterium JB025]
MKKSVIPMVWVCLCVVSAEAARHGKHEPEGRQMSTFRPPLVRDASYIDLDGDGDPDVLRGTVHDGIPVQWIDDDDDMKVGDLIGDRDSDCLMVDRNRDGNYGHWEDFIVDHADEDGDGMADVEIIADNVGLDAKKGGHYMIMMDDDKDGVFSYIDWELFHPECWQHDGMDDFMIDYNGTSTLLKVHQPTFNITDLRYNWENPFLFYDQDDDSYTEMAIRFQDVGCYTDRSTVKGRLPEDFATVSPEMQPVHWDKSMSYVAMTFDLDNDSGPGNAFDFDMTINFNEGTMDYQDQRHGFKSLRGLPEADGFFYDPRLRRLTELIYPDHETSWELIFQRGKWGNCWFVFDEDDDCDRWERVELLSPLDPFVVGKGKGGLDDNYQADTAGDRGEWDADNSGKGRLYLGGFDGRIHLYGAEWGAWRLDQVGYYYQGFCRTRDRFRPRAYGNEKMMPEKFGTVKYTDTNGNGFLDQLEYDLDGDGEYEMTHSLLQLGIDDVCAVEDTRALHYEGLQRLNERSAETIWKRAGAAAEKAQQLGIDPSWYGYYRQAGSTQEKYNRGFWLNLYLFLDMLEVADARGDAGLRDQVLKGYYSGDWSRVTAGE